jgi:hypothetical protein
MTAAGTIDVGAIGHTELGQGHGAGWNGATAADKSSSSLPAGQSFRSNWQAQLDSLTNEKSESLTEPESAEPTGVEFKNADGPQLASDAVKDQPASIRPALNLPASQILPARVSLGESLGRSQPAGLGLAETGLAASGEPSIGVRAAAGNPRAVIPADELDAGKAATSNPGDSRPLETPHRAVKSESEKASVATSPEPNPTAVVIPSIGVAIPAAPSPVVNPVQATRKPVEAELTSSLPIAVAQNRSSEVSPWGGLPAGLKAGANGAANHFGTVAQLPTVPSWTETGSQSPSVGGNAALNRNAEPSQAPENPRVDPDARKDAVEGSRPTSVEGNRTASAIDASTRETVRTTSPVEDSRPAEQTSQLARMTALPQTSVGTAQVSGATAGTGTGAGMDARIVANAQANPLPGPLPVSTSGPVQIPAQSSPVQILPMANPAPAAGIKSGARGTVAGVAGAAHGVGAQAQSSGLADGAGWMRDSTGALQPQTIASNNSSKTTAEPALREPFAALDAEPAAGAIAWTHASARQAEAGFEDPVLGWVGVRAELSGGGVHASLVPGSTEAAQELGRQMDGLHTYLAEQRTPVESLVMAAPSGSGANSGTGGGFGNPAQHEMGQGTGQGPGQNTREQAAREVESRITPVLSGAGRASPAQASAALFGSDVQPRTGGGSRISLVA